MNEYEALARALINTPQGAKVLSNLDKITAVLNRPEGKKLISSLAGSGEALKEAAQAATTGDKETAVKFISTLLSTREGMDMAKRIMELFNSKTE